jgi:hypothetical protein
VRFQLQARTGHPDFLDLPWQEPLDEWEHERIVEVPTGLHRHVVRTVEYDDRRYFLKELPPRLADREWRFLRHLKEEEVPVVDVVGVARDRRTPEGGELESVLITAQLEYGLPYRLLFARRDAMSLRDPMLDALVDLLVRIHLIGFMWGDCSLSNTLFRRDARRLAAYLVDTETGQLEEAGLTDGQRRYDLELAVERCSGELFDLAAAGLIPLETDVPAIAEALRERYEALWAELTSEEVVADEDRWRIHARLERINDLGYDVEEMAIDGDHDGEGNRLRFRTVVVEPGRHRRRLYDLTGLDAQEHQARFLLHDIDGFGLWLREFEGVAYSDEYVAHRWLDQSFRGMLARIPDEFRSKRDDAQLFHELLRYWWSRCGTEGEDLDLGETTLDFVDDVLRGLPDERTVVAASPDEVALLDEDVLDEDESVL